MEDREFGGHEFVAWICPDGRRYPAELQRCECGCGRAMTEGRMILRDDDGNEYEVGI
jgi:hypothetical protein